MLGRLLGLSVLYGIAFTFIKSIFPQPVLLLLFQGDGGAEGNLTLLSSVYMASGLLGGILGGLGVAAVFVRGSTGASLSRLPRSSLGLGLGLSLGFAVVIGFISTLLVLVAYASGLLPPGGVLDPLTLIDSSNFPAGTPLLVAWTFARDLLPAGLTGLFMSPLGANTLLKVYYSKRRPPQKNTEDDEFF